MQRNKLKTAQNRQYKQCMSAKHFRGDSFDNYYQHIISRKNHQCQLIQSPQLNQKITQINGFFDEVAISSVSTPLSSTKRIHKRLQRKKYQQLKQKIYASIQQFNKIGQTNLNVIFSLKQVILNDFLNEFLAEISKQCKQKGDILQYIWNSMFFMIEHIAERLSQHLRLKESKELKSSIQQHQLYQSMIENITKKHGQLAQKNEAQKLTLNTVVRELRTKRKQVDKLKRTQKILQNKVNQLKLDNLNIQTSYIDIVSELKDLSPQNVEHMLKARQELNREKKIKIKVRNKKMTKERESLPQKNGQSMNSLLQQIKQIANNIQNTPQLVSTLLGAAIDNYGLNNDDKYCNQLMEVKQSGKTNDVDIQVNLLPSRNGARGEQITQTTYSDKINFNLSSNMVTQTYGDFSRKKVILVNQETSTQDIGKKYVDWYFSLSQVISQKIQMRGQEDKNMLSPVVKVERKRRKHASDMNIGINWRNNKKKTDFSDKTEGEKNNPIIINVKNQIPSQFNFDVEKQIIKMGQKGLISKEGQIKKQRASNIPRKSINPLNKRSSNVSQRGSRKISQSQLNMLSNRTSLNRSSLDSNQNSHKVIKHRRKATNIPSDHYQKIRQQFSNLKFLTPRNSFNINIDQNKQCQIHNIFVNQKKSNFFYQVQQLNSQDQPIDSDLISRTFKQIENLGIRSPRRKGTTCSLAKSAKIDEQQMGEDQQNMLLNVCRDKYYKKGRKKRQRVSLIKYRNEFTSVKDKIEMIAKDVGEMMADKQDYLRKSVNNKNIKAIYKILMMTFAKAYDNYNKGIIISNLVFPLFQSFSLIYGNINTSEVYKRMINFIACLSAKTDNNIFKFFLFFLGLDKKSPYSHHVTICEVYLCLTLLQKISVQSKITLNIDSIYTDTNRIKDQLIGVLRQQKIPQVLCLELKRKVDQSLQDSSAMKNSDDNDAHLKINIYNIILLIIQEVIKCKLKMKQSFLPLVKCCWETDSKRVPIYLVECLLMMCVTSKQQNEIVLRLGGELRKNSADQRIELDEFYSILFENNLINMTQILQQNYLPLYRIKIPQQFGSYMTKAARNKNEYMSDLQYFEHSIYDKLQHIDLNKNSQDVKSVQIMKKLIFIKFYFKKSEEVFKQTIGELLQITKVCGNVV